VRYFVDVNGRDHEVDLEEPGGNEGRARVCVDGRAVEIEFRVVDDLGQVLVLCEGKSFALSIEGGEQSLSATLAGHLYDVTLEDERERAARAAEREPERGGGVVTAIMPGIVVEVLVSPGQSVEAGAPLLVLSAMKMQNEIAAPAAGVVSRVHVASGQAVSAGTRLLTLAPGATGP